MEVLGIDVSDYAVRIACLRQRSGGGAQLTGYWVEEFPQAVSGTENTRNVRRDVIERALGKALTRGSHVRVTLPSSALIMREFDMPFQSRDQLDKTVKFSMEEFLPYSIEDAVIDFMKMRNLPDGGKSHVFCVSSKKEYVREILDALAAKGIDPITIEVDFFPLISILRRQKLITEAPLVILQIDAARTLMLVLDNGELRIVRVIFAGYENLIETLVEKLRITVEQAEAVAFAGKSDPDMLEPEKWNLVEQEKKAFYKQLTKEMMRTTRSLMLSREPLSIYLTGGGANLSGIALSFRNEIGIDTSILQPLNGIDDKVGLANTHSEQHAAVAIGLAAQEIDGFPAQINLRQEELVFKGTFRQLKGGLAFLLLMLFIGLAGIGGYFHVFWQNEIDKLAQEKEKVAAKYYEAVPNTNEPPMLSTLEDMTKANNKEAERKKGVYKVRVSALRLWYEVNKVLKSKNDIRNVFYINVKGESLEVRFSVTKDETGPSIVDEINKTGLLEVVNTQMSSVDGENVKNILLKINYKK